MSRSNEPARIAPHPPLARYYPGAGERREFVTGIFDRTASAYDWINRVMSFGSGVRYRRDALRRAGLTADGDRLLDVAVGTGLVARAAHEILGQSGRITGIDPSAGMLAEAHAALPIALVRGVAERLPFADACFDFVTMGYALRHVADLESTFREYQRVLRPGGVLVVLELTPPAQGTAAYLLTRFYLRRVVPFLARLGPGGKDAGTLMEYFWDTVEQCVPPATILQAMAGSGFDAPRRRIVFRIFSEYVATKPPLQRATN